MLNLLRVIVCAALLGAAVTMRLVHAQPVPITLERIAILEADEKNIHARLEYMQAKLDLATSKQDSMLGWGAGAFSVLTIITSIQLIQSRNKQVK